MEINFWLKTVERNDNNYKNNYFQPLTGVRAIAAWMVFFHHYNPFTEQQVGKLFHDFVSEFYAGVTIFFVLSGFLITWRYFDKNDFSFMKYIGNRVARIYPVYLLLTVITFFYMEQIFDGKEFLLNVTFLKGFLDDYKFSGIAQGWSLTVEETFYFLAPVLFFLVARNKWYLVILPLFILLTGLVMVKFFSPLAWNGFFSSNQFMWGYTFFGRCFEFFAGMSLAIFFTKAKKIKSRYLTYFGLGLILISIWALALMKGNFDFGIEHVYGRWINAIGLSSATCVFFFGLMTEQTWVARCLRSKFFVLLGKSSYVFYLIHLGVIASCIRGITSNTIIVFVLINFVAIALFKLLEEPLNKLIRSNL
jgi:peptidoglycan/LPS O-acetylase OafA/YrhL